MNARAITRKALSVSQGLVVVWVLSLPALAQAQTKRTASVQVKNSTGRVIEWVSVFHKYSDNYKDEKVWRNVPNGSVPSEMLEVRYNTGFGTTGIDWWLIMWKYQGEDTVYRTDPNNGRALIDGVETVAKAVLPTAGAVLGEVGGFLLTKSPVAAQIGGAMGEETCRALARHLNSEKTAGFKQHILRPKDSHDKFAEATIIEIALAQVKITSPSSADDFGPTTTPAKKVIKK